MSPCPKKVSMWRKGLQHICNKKAWIERQFNYQKRPRSAKKYWVNDITLGILEEMSLRIIKYNAPEYYCLMPGLFIYGPRTFVIISQYPESGIWMKLVY